MDPKYLLKDELEFELASRGVYIKSYVPVLKKILSEMIETEQAGDETVYTIKAPKQSFENPTDEISICSSKLDILSSYVTEIDGKPDKTLFRRLVSRLYHVRNRIQFIVTKNDDEESMLKDLKEKCEKNISILESTDETTDEENLTEEDRKILQETLGPLGEQLIHKIEKDITPKVSPVSILKLPVEDKVVNPNIEDFEYMNINKNMSKLSRLARTSTVEESPSKRKLVPISQWGIKFSGDDSQSVNAFIERIEEIKDARNASDDDLWRYAIDFFEGNALIWYRANKNYVKNWEELVISLKRTFQSPFYQEELMSEINKRTQGKEESVIIYISVMQNMFNRLPKEIPERDKIMIILKNLQPYYQLAVCRDEFYTIADLVNVLRIIERTKINCDRFQEPQYRANGLEPDLAYKSYQPNKKVYYNTSEIRKTEEIHTINTSEANSKRCWNCREIGHLFRTCKLPKQRLFCYRCGKFGVVTKDCSCKGNEQGESSNAAKQTFP